MAEQQEHPYDPTELCAKAFRLAILACCGVVLVGMIAVAGIYPHAASEVNSLLETSQKIESTALAHPATKKN